MSGLHGAHFRNRQLEIAQDFQQKRLEGLVGAVKFIDEKNRSDGGIRLRRSIAN
jgi:hypothetical protein